MHLSDLDTDSDGWLIVRCTCGWSLLGPVPDNETATDVLMEHAFHEGAKQGEATS